ncbi:hypothetical protein HPP92_004654 [Vanilla planifolia]|uniref:Uncharacterized protein n=1 Tax=Vanilla planifolia TaxID=51239 RepID=A0A835VE61_VANPL|nr:hypothetical protein HPP92_004654 [Vanilla planifolia]
MGDKLRLDNNAQCPLWCMSAPMLDVPILRSSAGHQSKKSAVRRNSAAFVLKTDAGSRQFLDATGRGTHRRKRATDWFCQVGLGWNGLGRRVGARKTARIGPEGGGVLVDGMIKTRLLGSSMKHFEAALALGRWKAIA